ncbi:MAG: cell division protein FtsZ, partial [Candidatus Pacebacteria bacterium]|nr:cell division protein FtsZ [Candidatus Paceibacterota bacterium]
KGVLFSIAGGDDLKMFEIQDAAKIITESIDPGAKVIFGTIHDEKLKKGEVKVTVIASGFPEGMPKKGLFHFESAEPKEEKKSKLFGGNSTPAPVAVKEIPKQVEEKKPEIKVVDDNDDEWGAVPAFLRRSKIK